MGGTLILEMSKVCHIASRIPGVHRSLLPAIGGGDVLSPVSREPE